MSAFPGQSAVIAVLRDVTLITARRLVWKEDRKLREIRLASAVRTQLSQRGGRIAPDFAHVPAGHRSKLPGATAMRQVQVRDEDSLVVAVLVGIVLVSAASFAVAFFLH